MIILVITTIVKRHILGEASAAIGILFYLPNTNACL